MVYTSTKVQPLQGTKSSLTGGIGATRNAMNVNGICSRCERRRSGAPGAPKPLAKVAIVALAVCAFGAILPDFGRLIPPKLLPSFHIYPLGTLDVKVDNNGMITRIGTEGEGSQGLAVGDRINLGQTCDSRVAIGPSVFVACQPKSLSETPECSRTQKLVITGKPAGRDTVYLRPKPESLEWKQADYWGLFVSEVAGCAFISFSWWLVWRRPGLRTWGLFLYSVWFNSGQYFTWYANLPVVGLKIFDVLQAFFEALGLTGILLFALSFPRDSVDGWRRRAARLLPVLFVALLAVRIWTFGTLLWGSETEIVNRVWFGLSVVTLFAMAGLLVYSWLTQAEDRSQIIIAGLGAAVGLGCWLLIDSYETIGFPPWAWLEPVADFLYGAVVLLPIAIFVAIRRFRVIDIQFAIRRAVVVLIGVVIMIAVLEMLAHQLLIAHYPWLEEMKVPFQICLGLLGFLHTPAHHWMERMIFRRWHRVESSLKEKTELLVTEAADVQRVNEMVLDHTVKVLRLKCGALYRKTATGTFEHEHSFGLEIHCKKCDHNIRSELVALPSSDPVFTWFLTACESQEAVLKHSQRYVRLPHAWSPPHSETRSIPAHAIPIIYREGHHCHLTRIVFLGPHLMDQNLDPDEIDVLDELAMAAGTAYLLSSKRRGTSHSA